MQSRRTPGDDGTRSRATPNVVPLRTLARVPLPDELAEAIGAAMEAQERESDPTVRIALAIRMRRALESWLDGEMTSAQVVRALRRSPEA
jgi:hypothetical protein